MKIWGKEWEFHAEELANAKEIKLGLVSHDFRSVIKVLA